MDNILMRFLSEDSHDEHDDHGDDHGLEPHEKKKLQNIKIIVLFAMLVAGCFVFLPYSPCIQENS